MLGAHAVCARPLAYSVLQHGSARPITELAARCRTELSQSHLMRRARDPSGGTADR